MIIPVEYGLLVIITESTIVERDIFSPQKRGLVVIKMRIPEVS